MMQLPKYKVWFWKFLFFVENFLNRNLQNPTLHRVWIISQWNVNIQVFQEQIEVQLSSLPKVCEMWTYTIPKKRWIDVCLTPLGFGRSPNRRNQTRGWVCTIFPVKCERIHNGIPKGRKKGRMNERALDVSHRDEIEMDRCILIIRGRYCEQLLSSPFRYLKCTHCRDEMNESFINKVGTKSRPFQPEMNFPPEMDIKILTFSMCNLRASVVMHVYNDLIARNKKYIFQRKNSRQTCSREGLFLENQCKHFYSRVKKCFSFVCQKFN